nr:putative capsid protein [Chicken picobirnavirus]
MDKNKQTEKCDTRKTSKESPRDVRKPRGKKTYSDKRRDKEKEVVSETSNNDYQWYSVNDAIGSAVGNIPYNVFAGQKIDLIVKEGVTDKSDMTVPGVLSIDYFTAPGISKNGTSAVNISAKALYSYVRHQNSGHSNYEASDLMLYILAMDEIYTQFYEARRILNLAMTYDYVNRNVPDLILKALGTNPDSIRANIAQFRGRLNLIAAKISSLAVPNAFHLFKRHALIARTILMDSSSIRGQFYVWKTTGYRVFDPTATTGGQLVYTEHTANRTYEDIINELETMLSAVLGNEDMNIMSGDILKAYGRENLIIVSNIDENETANFIFDENMLAQVENSHAEPIDVNQRATWNITQDNNEVIFNPKIAASAGFTQRKFFNSHKDQPDWKDALEWSRGMCVEGSCGTEFLTGYTMTTYRYTDDSNKAVVASYPFSSYFVYVDDNSYSSLTDIAKFDWHPMWYTFSKDGTKFYGVIGDLKKFTVLDVDTISKLNDSAVMGEFNALLLSKGTTY